MENYNIKLTAKHLEIAKKAAHQVWEKYDDTHGYRTEKQTANAKVSIEHPDNIWFFIGQFDSSNQVELLFNVLTEEDSLEKDELALFLMKHLKEQAEHVKQMLEEWKEKEAQNGKH